MPVEASCLGYHRATLNQPFKISENLLIIISGIGSNNARRAAELLQFEQVNGLISWGTAAGLGEAGPGDLLLPEFVINRNGQQIDTDSSWRLALSENLQSMNCRIHTAPLAETRLLLENTGQKSALHNETGAIAADMESAVIAKVARDNHLPCLVIRSIVDPCDQTLPYAITRHTDIYGNTPLARIIQEIAKQPRLIHRVIQLAGQMRKALNTLKKVAQQGRSNLVQAGG